LLSNSRRRLIIKALEAAGGEACLREIVRRVAKMESGGLPDRRLMKSIYTGIVQNHLPKLSLAGLVEYDRETDTVRLIELPREYRYYLEAVEKGDIPWCLYYLGLSLAGFLSSLLYITYTHSWGGSSLLTLIFSALLLISSLLHTAHTYGLKGIELIPYGIRAITKGFRRMKRNEKEGKLKKRGEKYEENNAVIRKHSAHTDSRHVRNLRNECYVQRYREG